MKENLTTHWDDNPCQFLELANGSNTCMFVIQRYEDLGIWTPTSQGGRVLLNYCKSEVWCTKLTDLCIILWTYNPDFCQNCVFSFSAVSTNSKRCWYVLTWSNCANVRIVYLNVMALTKLRIRNVLPDEYLGREEKRMRDFFIPIPYVIVVSK